MAICRRCWRWLRRHALWLAGEGPQAAALIAAAYRAPGAPSSSVSIYNGADEGKMAAAVKWLLTP